MYRTMFAFLLLGLTCLSPFSVDARECAYLQDLPELTHAYTFRWDFASSPMGMQSPAGSGVGLEGNERLEKLQENTHPEIFKWDFEPSAGGPSTEAGSNFPINEEYLRDLPELTHPDIFKWDFSKDKEPEDTGGVEAVKEKKPEDPEPTDGPTKRPPEKMEWIALPQQTVYFDYDKSVLKSKAKEKIETNVAYLKEHPDYKVLIEGHCDERGTQEYNLALGERRAKAIRDYMGDLGIDSSRIRIKSWGEEQPVALGHTEKAWSQNRRGEMYYSKTK